MHRPEFCRSSVAALRAAPLNLYQIVSGTMPVDPVLEHLDVVEDISSRSYARGASILSQSSTSMGPTTVRCTRARDSAT
jgi:hypothetical protein